MNLQDLAPENTKRVVATAISTFDQFLFKEKVTREFVQASLLADSRGAAFVKLMDRFALFLVFSSGKGGEPRKLNTVMSYYRNVKNWLLDCYPQHRTAIEQQLLKMGRILERHCLLRQHGGMIDKAPACTKNDLSSQVEGLYHNAVRDTEYQDAARFVVMWYAFGRTSDLTYVPKSNLSLSADNVPFIRLIRAKTFEEQGLSLFPDKDSFITCPINAIAMALAMQTFSTASLFNLTLSFNSDDSDLSLLATVIYCAWTRDCDRPDPLDVALDGGLSHRRARAQVVYGLSIPPVKHHHGWDSHRARERERTAWNEAWSSASSLPNIVVEAEAICHDGRRDVHGHCQQLNGEGDGGVKAVNDDCVVGEPVVGQDHLEVSDHRSCTNLVVNCVRLCISDITLTNVYLKPE
ncbi:hypothetical protein ON010_g15530 [Phytophthora cinnamomi]|nr:hypothetical protein ON010_g15530 [Phytophthora cinnamomi]